MSDAEWAVTEPALPAPAWTLGKGGRPGGYCRRDVVDGIRYLVKEGIQWRAVPVDFPHWRTVYDYADGWQKTGATEGMHDELRRQCRIAAGRKPEPTAAVIDSQSVKAAETVAKSSRGYDAGKKINGRYLKPPGFPSMTCMTRVEGSTVIVVDVVISCCPARKREVRCACSGCSCRARGRSRGLCSAMTRSRWSRWSGSWAT
ncbi:MAG: transposase [Streptosporangiaceae bacterium]